MTRMRSGRIGVPSFLALCVLCAMLVPAATAHANTGDVAGVGSEGIARAGAMTAVADGFEALFYNPAGLAGAERAELSIGYMRFVSGLSWEGVGAPEPEGESGGFNEPTTLHLGLVIPLGPVRVGAYLSTMPTKLLSLNIEQPGQVTFGAYSNTTQRIYVLLGGAVDLGRGFSAGLRVSIFAGVDGLAVATEGPTRDVEPGIAIGADTEARVGLGLRYEHESGFRIGINYRQAFGVPIRIRADSTVGNVPLELGFTVQGMQTPHHLVLGAAHRFGPIDLSLDLGWQRWEGRQPPWVDVDTSVTGLTIASPDLPPAYRDAFDVRLGGQYAIDVSDDVGLRLRAGIRFASRQGRDQPSVTNFIDNHKLGIAVGAGVRLADVWGLPLEADLHFSMDHMFDRSYTKDPMHPSGASRFTNLSGGGQFYTLGLTLTLGLTQ